MIKMIKVIIIMQMMIIKIILIKLDVIIIKRIWLKSYIKECDNENDDKLNSFVLRFNDSSNNDLNKNIC